MAVMTTEERQAAARRAARRMFQDTGRTATLNLAQILAAVDATDDWCEANAAAFNAALPAAFRNTATVAQKAELLAYVALRRAGVND